ncbi:unnamed protein product [Cylicocyclus nassatus]|uniref:Uncharacterized protein n=1 Tax=Cylicocyclus nassatus TaxID=53992 RepID=A0AA36M2I4_CYLNA|nr:unnamed protein product [Cylicocyclus nassatus]
MTFFISNSHTGYATFIGVLKFQHAQESAGKQHPVNIPVDQLISVNQVIHVNKSIPDQLIPVNQHIPIHQYNLANQPILVNQAYLNQQSIYGSRLQSEAAPLIAVRFSAFLNKVTYPKNNFQNNIEPALTNRRPVQGSVPRISARQLLAFVEFR